MTCIEFAAQLGRHYPQFQAQNTTVLAIGSGTVTRAQTMAKNTRLPFPVLADPDRQVYAHFGLFKKMLLIQQSGTLLIDKQGVIRHITRITNPQQWFSRDEI